LLVSELQLKSSMGRHLERVKRHKGVAVATAALLVVGGAVVAIVSTRSSPPTEAPRSELPQRVGDAIQISDAFRRAADLGTTPAVRAPLTPLVKVVGEAAFDPTSVAAVGTRAPGIVTNVLHVKGDSIRKGDLLAEIESPQLVDAQADVRVALAKKEAALLNATREESLLDRQLTTAREYEEARAALEQQQALMAAATERVRALGGTAELGHAQLRSPASGVIAERAIDPGQNVAASVVAFRIGNLDELWVLLRVFERHVTLIRAGDAVEIHLLADRTQVIHGTVAHVGTTLDEATRTSDVRVEIDNAARLLRPGQAVEATIRASGPARVALVVPASAVTLVDGAPTVFVAEAETRFVARKVELGIDGGDQVEVTSGVREGEAVVSRSVLALKSELFR